MFGLLFFVSMGFPILSFVNSLSGNLSNRQSDELRLYYMVRPRSQNDGGQPSETVFVWLGFRQSGEERCPFKQAQWINSCLARAGISSMDRFRLAQDRTAWRKQVLEAFPLEQVDPQRSRTQCMGGRRPHPPLGPPWTR